jgi:hypothetical protein
MTMTEISFSKNVQPGSEAHPPSCKMGAGGGGDFGWE